MLKNLFKEATGKIQSNKIWFGCFLRRFWLRFRLFWIHPRNFLLLHIKKWILYKLVLNVFYLRTKYKLFNLLGILEYWSNFQEWCPCVPDATATTLGPQPSSASFPDSSTWSFPISPSSTNSTIRWMLLRFMLEQVLIISFRHAVALDDGLLLIIGCFCLVVLLPVCHVVQSLRS